jgi:hypothetical protein
MGRASSDKPDGERGEHRDRADAPARDEKRPTESERIGEDQAIEPGRTPAGEGPTKYVPV